MTRRLVVGVDSSTQSTKVEARDLESGAVVATGSATELGRIAELAEEAEAATTPLEERLAIKYVENVATGVIKAGEKFELLGTNSLEEFAMATPALVGGRLLIRTQGRPRRMRVSKPAFRSDARSAMRPRRTRMPAASRPARPPPFTAGLGSSAA